MVELFSAYPAAIRKRLLRLREIIFEVAASTDGVGKIYETLKWGEPAYVTTESRGGSTIRIDRCRNAEKHYAIYFHCQTNLVESFCTLFPAVFTFEGNRGIIFEQNHRVPVIELKICIQMALTYHLAKRRKPVASAKRKLSRARSRRTSG